MALFRYVLICCLFCLQLSAEEAPVEARAPEPVCLVNMTSAPSSYVNGSVNVISGDYVSSGTDYTLSGPDPYVLGHSYCSSSIEKGNIGHGWNFQHSHLLQVFQPYGINYTKDAEKLISKKRDPRDAPRRRHGSDHSEKPPKPPIPDKNPYTHLFLIEPCGGKILFKGDGWAEHFYPQLKKTGYTNIGSGQIGGACHVKNIQISWDAATDEWSVTLGDGTKRKYARRYGQTSNRKPGRYNYHVRDYHIIEEKKPSGNLRLFEYNNQFKIAHIKTVNHDKSVTLNWVTFHYKHHEEVKVETSDGHEFIYKLKKIDGMEGKDYYVVSHIMRPGEIDESVEYGEKTYYHNPRVEKVDLGKGRFLATSYYHRLGPNDIGDFKPQIDEEVRRKFLAGRVRLQRAPMGQGGESIITHAYFYHRKDDESEAYTTVRDALGNKTRYFYNDEKRLLRIEQEERDAVIVAEQFIWGERDSQNEGNLLVRTLFDETNKASLCRVYEYDRRGNVTKETLFGNFTGNTSGVIQFESNGYPKEGSDCDKEVYQYVYSDDGFNVKLSERDPYGNYTYYTYKEDTNLIKAIYSCEGKAIKKRQFFSYDASALCIKEITDDGSTLDKNDLQSVTERHSKQISHRLQMPHFGAPEIISEYYLDLKKNEEKLLSKTINSFNKAGLVVHKELLDATEKVSSSFDYDYDNLGRLIATKDSLGRHEQLKYDAAGHLVKKSGPRTDVTTHYEYDVLGRLIKEEEVHATGVRLATKYKYDLLGRKIAAIDPQGNETTTEYDALSRITKISYPQILLADGTTDHPVREFRYKHLGCEIIEKDERGFETKRYCNARGRPLTEKLADGTKKQFFYDLSDRLIKEIAPNGLETHYTYDAFDRLTKTKQKKEGHTLFQTEMSYNAFHLMEQTGPTNEKTTFTYDAAGRKTQMLCGLKEGERRTTYVYDTANRLREERLWVGSKSYVAKAVQYDALDRVVSEKTKDERDTIYSVKVLKYDLEGNVCETKQFIDGHESSLLTYYHPHGIPHKKYDALGNVTVIEIDYFLKNKLGQYVLKKTATDAKGAKIEEIYNARGWLVKLTSFDPYGNKIAKKKLFYDQAGNTLRIEETAISSSQEERIVSTVFTYGPLNRLESLKEAFGTKEQKETKFLYNSLGQKETTILASGDKIYSNYDEKGRLKQYYDKQGTFDYRYHYDASDRVLSVKNGLTGKATTRSYDSFGQLECETLETGITLDYRYDPLGRIASIQLPDSSKIGYAYSPACLKSVTRRCAKDQVLYQYEVLERDLSGNILSAELPLHAGKIEYKYDLLGRPIKIEHALFKEEVPHSGYDAIGNLVKLKVKDALGEKTMRFSYDFLSQLTSENGLHDHTYTYDSLFNRLTKDETSYEVNALHAVTHAGEKKYKYDANGNRERLKSPDGDVKYTYDSLDRLTRVEMGNRYIEYSYDAFHRRLSKKISTQHFFHVSVDSEERYLYLQDNEIGVVDTDGKIQELRLLSEGLGAEIGASIALEIQDKLLVPLHDHRGNISTLIDPATGALVEQYRYSAFGEEELFGTNFEKINTSCNPWRFSSKRHDRETGLVYFGRRYYDPTIGKWLTQDPLGHKAGPNLYAYVQNNPLTHVDLYGLIDEAVGGAAAGADRFSGVRNFFADSFSAARNFVSRAFTSVRNLICRTLDSFSYHAIPIDGIKLGICNTIRALMGKGPRKIDHSIRVKLYDGKANLLGTSAPISCTNTLGVNNTLKGAKQAVGELFNNVDKSRIVGVELAHNSGHGILSDFSELLLNMAGFETNSVKNLRNAWQEVHAQCKSMGIPTRILHIAHSQGGWISYRALKSYREKAQVEIDVITAGTTKIISSQDGAHEALNIINRSDLAPLFCDPIRYLQAALFGSKEVQFIGSPFRLPFSTHSFRHAEYQQALGAAIGQYAKK